MKELGESFLRNEKGAAVDNGELYVKFFDDEDLELMPVTDLNKIESYSCKNKKKYIRCLLSTKARWKNSNLTRAGFRMHEENKKGKLGGANLRLAQFYKA